MNLTEQIHSRIEELLATVDEKSSASWRVASSTNALPLYADWTGCIAVKPDGSFIFYEWDTSNVSEEDDPYWQLLALVTGSKDYPELSELLPVKSEDARECSMCKGAGYLVVEGHVCSNINCGQCFGLGWVTDYILSLSEGHVSANGAV